MSEVPCQTCSAVIADGATFCAGCGHRLDEALASVCAYQGLAYDLDLARSRQARLSDRGGSRPTDTAVSFDDRAGQAATRLHLVLAHWAGVVATETGVGTVPTFGPACRSCRHRSCREVRTRGLPASTSASLAAWLRPRVGWLRHHPEGAKAYTGIADAVAAARRVVDRPAERLYAGPCDCGEDLYARLDASYVVCRSAEHEEPPAWPVEERRRWLLRSAEDVLASTTEISRALTRYARPVTPSALRGYVARGRLVAKGKRMESGRAIPEYRLGDVLDILADQDQKASA